MATKTNVVTVAPNPSIDRIEIKSSKPIIEFVISDLSGKVIHASHPMEEQFVTHHQLPAGIYLLHSTDESGFRTNQFIFVQR